MTQHTSIRDRILADIASGAFAFGERLTIDDLAIRYQASHMPVREALRALQGAGVLEIGLGRSARVRAFDPAYVENLFSTRSALEVMLVRRAAQHCTPAQLRHIEAIEVELEQRVAAQDYTGALQLNRRMHATINDIAENPDAVAIIDRHCLLIAALWQRVGYGPERYPGVISDHRHLLRALARHDVEAAGTLMGAHVIKAKFDLLARIAGLQPAAKAARHAA
ncbi:MAG TPA: GntR family transcriptional regulator [Acetobacteraceae bacterium]|jgi:DNA-binding GntR family transcriptional regulator